MVVVKGRGGLALLEVPSPAVFRRGVNWVLSFLLLSFLARFRGPGTSSDWQIPLGEAQEFQGGGCV